jgi:uncharacterized membrane protein YbaN (DUF454 family)
MSDILIGVLNFVTGVIIGVLSPLLTIVIFALILPFAAVAAASREIRDALWTYPAEIRGIAHYGFKIADNGLKRIRRKP